MRDFNLRDRELSLDRTGNLLKNIMLLNKSRNKKTLAKLIDLEVIFDDVPASRNSQLKEELFKFVDIFEDKYKDNWDLHFHKTTEGDFKVIFIVRYPEITITNSEGAIHYIKELLVGHPLVWKNNHLYTGAVKGTRLCKNKYEIKRGYQQSHLPNTSTWLNAPFYFSNFCLGSDTDVVRMLAEFDFEMDWERYELYLFCIDSMLSWESLEGVPYSKIKDITTAFNQKIADGSWTVQATKIVFQIIKNKVPLDVDFYISENRYKIKTSERTISFIRRIIDQLSLPEGYLAYRIPNTFNQYVTTTSADPSKAIFTINSTAYLIFRGSILYPRVITQKEKATVEEKDFIINPYILKNVIRELEFRLYEKAVTKSGIKKHHSLNNANRSVSSDTIPMQEYF